MPHCLMAVRKILLMVLQDSCQSWLRDKEYKEAKNRTGYQKLVRNITRQKEQNHGANGLEQKHVQPFSASKERGHTLRAAHICNCKQRRFYKCASFYWGNWKQFVAWMETSLYGNETLFCIRLTLKLNLTFTKNESLGFGNSYTVVSPHLYIFFHFSMITYE